MKNIVLIFTFIFLGISFSIIDNSYAGENPKKYILEGVTSYDYVKNKLKILSDKVERETGISRKTLGYVSGTMSQILQKKVSTKLLKINTNINNISVRPLFEYSFETKNAVASVGINFSF